MAGRQSMKRKSRASQSPGRKSMKRKSRASKSPGRRQSRRQSSRRKSRKGSISSRRSGSRASSNRKRTSIDVPYEHATLNVSNIHPFFLLLRCHERSIILKALNYIYEHTKYNFEDVKLMYRRTYMEDVKELSRTSEKYIPEAALRLLALITLDPDSRKYFASDDDYIAFLGTQINSKNVGSVKYSMKIIANILEDQEVVKKIMADGNGFDWPKLFTTLNNSDPDICHYVLKVIGNIFHDIVSAEKFVNHKDFNFVPLFNLLESPFIELQKKALTLVKWLGCQTKTAELKERFMDQKGIDRMFGVLMNFQWRDIHAEALEILRVYLEVNEDRIRSLERSGVSKFINYIDFCENDVLIAKDLGNILDIATTVFGKLELVELNFVPIVTSMLSDGTKEMKLGACFIINEMLKNVETVRLFTEIAPVPELLDIVIDVDHSWDLRGAAMGVLHNLAKFSSDMAYLLAKMPVRGKLKNWILHNLVGMPNRNKIILYDLLSVLVQHQMVRPLIVEFPLIWAFLLGLQESNPNLTHVQIVSSEALFYVVPEEPAVRQFIVAVDGMRIVARCLFGAKNPSLIAMTCNLIRVAVENDQLMLMALLKMQVLDWLVKHRQIWTEIEAAEWAATALQNHFLPAKFEYRGRLNFNDITKNGFYLRREIDSPENLPIPPHIVDEPGRSNYTIVQVNFKLKEDRDAEIDNRNRFVDKVDRNAELDDKCAHTYKVAFEEVNETENECDLTKDPLYQQKCSENSLKLAEDERIILILEDTKNRLKEADKQFGPRDYCMPFDHGWAKSRIEVLVAVVTEALGAIEAVPCRDHNMNLYVQELKFEVNSSVLPLGRLKKGGSLERSLLFKILADQIGLPCTLWRGHRGNGWNEIALMNLGSEFPMKNKEEKKAKTEDKPEMPTRLIYPTHIVDLVDTPGRLLEIESLEAKHYTGRPMQSVLYRVPESNPPPINTCLITIPAEE